MDRASITTKVTKKVLRKKTFFRAPSRVAAAAAAAAKAIELGVFFKNLLHTILFALERCLDALAPQEAARRFTSGRKMGVLSGAPTRRVLILLG